MRLTLEGRRHLAAWVITSLMICAFMPVSAEIFGDASAAHINAESIAAGHQVHAVVVFDGSSHHPVPAGGVGDLCDDEPARLPSELSPPLLGSPTQAFMIAFPAAVSPLKSLLSSGPRTRYPPGRRSHLALGRIQV